MGTTHNDQTPRRIALGVLNTFVGSITANVVLESADRHLGKSNLSADTCPTDQFIDALLSHSKHFVSNEAIRERVGQALRSALDDTHQARAGRVPPKTPAAPRREDETTGTLNALWLSASVNDVQSKLHIQSDADIMEARRSCKELCTELGFSALDCVKVVTVVSELARNIQRYAGSGTILVTAIHGPRRGIEVVATDHGPGIPNLDQVLRGNHKSTTGMGRGLVGSKAIMDEFDLSTKPSAGTRVRARKYVDRSS